LKVPAAAPADFYSSRTGFVYNFVSLAESSRYAIDPPTHPRRFTWILTWRLSVKRVSSSSFIVFLRRSPRWGVARRDRSEAIVALQEDRKTLCTRYFRIRCWNASNCAFRYVLLSDRKYRKAGVHRSFNPLTRRSFANALLRNGRITVLHSFLPVLYIIQPPVATASRQLYAIHCYTPLLGKQERVAWRFQAADMKRRPTIRRACGRRRESRITITTYIYVGESLESSEDPFTVRNREFRVTLRGTERRYRIWCLLYGVAFILQVIARLQVTRGFINCLDVISPQRLHVAAVSLCFSIPIFNISHFYTYVWESFRHKLKISVVIGKINMQIMPRHCVLPL